MNIPNAARATVSEEKLTSYLLSSSHPVGRFKAVFFGSLGYSASDPEKLRASLLDLALQPAQHGETSEFGQKYEIRGRITGPNGRSADIVTVWILLTNESAARLITAYSEN